MALTYTSFNSFDEVVARYNNTTPMRGSTNAGKDIRPIGDRARKYERIVKISPNCYALSDGYHYGDEHFGGWGHPHTHVPTLSDMEKCAPIVWRRKRDGTEEVTLRNGFGDYTHCSRYAFLYRHTPKDLWFHNRNGKHFIRNGSTYYYLAKVRTAPKAVYDTIKEQDRTHGNSYVKRHAAWVMKHDDNSAVVFRKNEHGGWDHVEGTGRDVSALKGPTVNKAVKAKFKDDIAKLFEWGMAMSPLLPLEDSEYVHKRTLDIVNYFHPEGFKGYSYVSKPTELRRVLRDGDHPLYLSLWIDFAANCKSDEWRNPEYYTKTIETKEDLQRVRARYNTWVNKKLGFMNKKGN